jgi:hypothetical protein
LRVHKFAKTTRGAVFESSLPLKSLAIQEIQQLPGQKNNCEYNDGRCYRVSISEISFNHNCSPAITNSFALMQIWPRSARKFRSFQIAVSLPDYSQSASRAPLRTIHRGTKLNGSIPYSSLSRPGTVSGKASAINASAVAIALVLPIRRDEWVIALPLCPTLARQLLTNSWREAERT